MGAQSLLLVIAGLSGQQVLDQALELAEPPPGLRAAFVATLSSPKASRQIVFDPSLSAGERAKVVASRGVDEELDRIVSDWIAEPQADTRLFADDLRESLDAGRFVERGQGWSLSFRHRLSPNDSPVDAEISRDMVGELALDPVNGKLASVSYRLGAPIRLGMGASVTEYSQSYLFGFSQRWNVSFLTGYTLTARGGRWGLQQSRRFDVAIGQVEFFMAGDASQAIASKALTPVASTAALVSHRQ